MTKSEVISKVAKETYMSRSTVEAVIDSFLETIITEVSKGNHVKLIGFGTFLASKLKRRVYGNPNNPNSGEKIIREEHMVPKFRAGKVFCDSVRET